MRYIPSDLKRKLDKRFQVKSENAEPKMKIHITRGLARDMFNVFTIHEGITNGNTDLAVSREIDTLKPSRAYVTHMFNSKIRVLSKSLPYEDERPWVGEFNIDEIITDSSIEFNGHWIRNDRTRRFDLITDRYPYIFYVSSGNLYVQYWNETRRLLSSKVDKISVIRGWIPAQAGHTQDQGLIVAYIKSGRVYYRNYCLNIAGTYSWEVEREVTSLPSNCVNIHLSRTTDFRVVFTVGTTTGDIYYAVTEMNWAGMSFFPENITCNVNDVKLNFIKLNFRDEAFRENVTAKVNNVDFEYCPFDYEILKVVSSKKSDSRNIRINFNYEIIDNGKLNNVFEIAGQNISVAYGSSNSELIIATDKDLSMFTTVLYNGVNNRLMYRITDACKQELEEAFILDFSDNVEVIENISASVDITELEMIKINFIDNKFTENISANATVGLGLIHINDVPV